MHGSIFFCIGDDNRGFTDDGFLVDEAEES